MKTLFIGNSHTFYNDMPQTFARLYQAGTGEQMDTVMMAHPAVDLEWHVKHFFDIRYNLLYGNFDYCIVQQMSHPFPGKNITLESVDKINQFCKLSNTKLLVTETWAKKQSPEDQELLNNAFHLFDAIDHVTISPVGEIWSIIRKHYPEIELYSYDHAHASALGDYLNACVHYAVITGNKTEGLPEETIDFLQGNIKCPDNSGVINDRSQLTISLDPDECKAIQCTIDQFFMN